MANLATIAVYNINSQGTYTVPFDYLSRRFVRLTLFGGDRKVLTLGIDYRFISKTTVQLTNVSPSGYSQLEVRRVTSASERLVTYYDGSILRAGDLNASQLQAIHIAEEGRDLTNESFGLDEAGNLDARNRKVVRVLKGSEVNDAVNFGQLQEYDTSTLNNAIRAELAATRLEAIIADAGNSIVVPVFGKAFARSLSERFADCLRVRDFGAVGNGSDETQYIQNAIDMGKLTGKTVLFEARTYVVSQTLKVNGVSLEGQLAGYFNRQGTTIKGDGTFDVIAQTAYGAADITHSVRNIRVTHAQTGFNFAYVVNSKYENLFVEDSVDGFRLGRAGLFGPLFNDVLNVNTRKMTRYGVVLGGNVNCNNNNFVQGFYDGKVAGLVQETILNGTGAVNNTFHMIELGGSGSDVGAIFNGYQRSLTISDCYFEPQGANVVFEGIAEGCVLRDNLYAGHFKFADGHTGLVVSKRISNINIDGGLIYHANAANKNFTFLQADYAETPRHRNAYMFSTEPFYGNYLSENTFKGMRNFAFINYNTTAANTAHHVILTEETKRRVDKLTVAKEFPNINEWTDVATVVGAALQFAHSVIRFKVTASCRNTSAYYLLGFDLDVTARYNQTALQVTEHLFKIYGSNTAKIIEYQVISRGDNAVLQVRNSSAAVTDQAFMSVEVAAAGSEIREAF